MALDLRLDTKLSQSLVMTPRLQQAIKLLQYNHVEMVAHVQEALLENPTLEAVPDSEHSGDRELQEHALKSEASDSPDEGPVAAGEIDWEKLLSQMSERRASAPRERMGQDDLPPIETNLTYGESLADHLHWQLNMTKCSDDEAEVAEAVIENLDHRGYLVGIDLEELATSLDIPMETVVDAVEMVQHFEPIGCGARDLAETLTIQAKVRFPEDPNFVAIIGDHLSNIERRNYAAIAKSLDLEVEDVIEYHKMIQELEPLPGRGYTNEEPRYITPDLYVVRRTTGEWYISLNEDGMPDLRISGYYQNVMQNASKEDKEYLLDKLRGAEFLIKSINKRRKTIRRVMESILKFQRDFFDHGATALRPLVLQDVADDIGVHMSTVSRTTHDKYVHTPHGIFELKYFFSAGVRQSSGDDKSSEAIKTRIRALVADENPKRPLSDQKLADALKAEGIRVARRTVAKYREALGILPSSRRKQMF